MNATFFWQMFLETGAPEAYLLYNKAKRMEETHVFDDPGLSVAGHGLQ